MSWIAMVTRGAADGLNHKRAGLLLYRGPLENLNLIHAMLWTRARLHSTVHPKWVFQTVPPNDTEFFQVFSLLFAFLSECSSAKMWCCILIWYVCHAPQFESLGHCSGLHAARQKQFSRCQQWRVASDRSHCLVWEISMWSNVIKLTQYPISTFCSRPWLSHYIIKAPNYSHL